MKNKNSKKKNNTSFLKKIEYWIKGFLFSLGVLSSLAVSDMQTIGASQAEHDRQIGIENKTKDVFEKNQNLLDLAKKIAAYEYNKNKNEDEKISIENIRNSVELKIYHGHSHIDPFSMSWKKDGQGTPYALIDSSKISDFGGNGEYMFFSINGESGKAAKKGRFGKQYPAYFTNETINTEKITKDINSFMFKDEKIYSLLANLVTAHNNQNTGKEVEDYLEEAKKLLKEYIDREGVEISEYLMTDLDAIEKNENNNGMAANDNQNYVPTNTYGVTNQELAESVLGSDVNVSIPELDDNNRKDYNYDER